MRSLWKNHEVTNTRCNEMTFPLKFMKIHYFSQIEVDYSLRVSILNRPNKDLKILQFFYFLKFLRTKIATFYHNLQDPWWRLLNLVKLCWNLSFYQVFERIRLGNSGSYEISTEKEGATFLQHSEVKKHGLIENQSQNLELE